MNLFIALLLVFCLLFAGCTQANEKASQNGSQIPTPSIVPMKAPSELYSDQLDKSIEELEIVG